MIVRFQAFTHCRWRMHIPLIPWLIKGFYRIALGVVLPPSVRLGRGVTNSYQGLGTVIHKDAVIGDRAVISTGVTIGGRGGRMGAPVIGEGALIGTGAKVLGPITVGKFASVGANAVVIQDVPPYAVVVGVPAKLVRINRPEDIPDYSNY